MFWHVGFTGRSEKQVRGLSSEIQTRLFALVLEIEKLGPVRKAWPHFGRIMGKKDCYHCYLKRGKPTYVAVWKIKDKGNRFVEVRYVGTHENADYRRIC